MLPVSWSLRAGFGGKHGPLPVLLIGLTVVTGLVDAYSYLVLGHVFVANMTGNVVFLGFALAGSGQFSVAASVVALAAFAAGAVAGGRIARAHPHHRARLLFRATLAQTLIVLASAVFAQVHGDPGPNTRYVPIVLLGLAMGGQNAVVRRLGVPDLTTTVLTMTVTGLAADSRLATGLSPATVRRAVSVLSMFAGALAGAWMVLSGAASGTLATATFLLAVVTAVIARHRNSEQSWVAA